MTTSISHTYFVNVNGKSIPVKNYDEAEKLVGELNTKIASARRAAVCFSSFTLDA